MLHAIGSCQAASPVIRSPSCWLCRWRRVWRSSASATSWLRTFTARASACSGFLLRCRSPVIPDCDAFPSRAGPSCNRLPYSDAVSQSLPKYLDQRHSAMATASCQAREQMFAPMFWSGVQISMCAQAVIDLHLDELVGLSLLAWHTVSLRQEHGTTCSAPVLLRQSPACFALVVIVVTIAHRRSTVMGPQQLGRCGRAATKLRLRQAGHSGIHLRNSQA